MKEILKQKTKEIEEIIYPYFKVEGGSISALKESMEYTLTAGGKRLRPMIMRESALLFGEEPCGLHVFMAALEMIHNYSLVHDDLPAMDNDNLRHGKPSTFAKYGEANGILCGDALLNRAYEIVIDQLTKNLNRETAWAATILADASGSTGMVGGQSLDVMFDKSDEKPTLENVLYIYENKTGKLLRAAFTIGAVLSKADDGDIKKLDKIGENIGFAFQVVDDILDITGDEKLLGKPIGSDDKNGKLTYVHLVGIDEARKKVELLTNEAVDLLMSLPGDKDFLKDLLLYLVKRDY